MAQHQQKPAFPLFETSGGNVAISANNRPERRVFEAKLELRKAKNGTGPGLMCGYAAKYRTMSQDLGGFFETLAPGAFRDVMSDDVRCLRNHEDDNLLGRTRSGTLRLSLDDTGLWYECELPDTQVGRDTAELVRRGDMSGSSFQFNLEPSGQDWDMDGPMPVRTITRVARLYDVSPVTNPAYEDTEVDMRSVSAALDAQRGKRVISFAKTRVALLAFPCVQ